MTSKLIAEDGLLKGHIFALENGTEWFLGRDPDLCTLVIEDPKVSRQHALLKKQEDTFFIENLSQTNPILVNNAHLEEALPLKEGDRLKIGATLFYFTEKDVDEKTLEKNKSSSPEQDYVDSATEISTEEPTDASSEPAFPTIYEEISAEEVPVDAPPLDLSLRERFLLKIISGPQTGAEFSMSPDKSYVIGSDPATCDVILYDLSVSRRHARITVTAEEKCYIADLESRNGVVINDKKIEEETELSAQDVIFLGTTSFVIVDRESESHTIFSSAPSLAPLEELKPEETETEIVEEVEESVPTTPKTKLKTNALDAFFASKVNLSICAIIIIIILLIIFGISSLFTSKEEIIPVKNPDAEITTSLQDFPEVTSSFNKATGTLFLVGHVLTPIDKSQLEYNLKGLTFISHLDDTNVIVDQNIWQEQNNLIAKNPLWTGVSIHAAKPGVFVVTGYLRTRQEFAQLTDYLNLNFPYLDKLQNRVAVEEDILARVNSDLFAQGLNGVTTQIANGEMVLAGFIASNKEEDLQTLIKSWKTLNGLRSVKNFVVPLSPAEAVINISERYQVTGFSTHDHTNINVMINGLILTRGDVLDGMTITSIQSNVIFLEKDGLKFKIKYNQ
ncbi:MAG: type III secretion system inner membrane ring subunit SctD [Chlamydiales bacterium]|nr:type III secretion system inner membrane ring subunit SctD [Chlamydiales bacterium]